MKYFNLVAAFALSAVLDHFAGQLFAHAGVQLALAPIIAAAAITAGSSLLSKYLPGGPKQEQVPLETPEQKAARAKLMDFANTGKFGDFTAGEKVPLQYGDYNMTGFDNQSMTALQKMLSQGIPSQYKMGDNALKGILDGSQANMDSQFSAFNTGVDRSIRNASADLKRGAGFAGNLYSTNTIKGLGDVQARGVETKTQKLADLTNQMMDRRLQAIPMAYQSAESQQANQINSISAAQNYGSLTRKLNDAQIKARDAELLRRRAELQLPIQAAEAVAGSQSNFGVPSVQAPSPYADLLNMTGQLGGMYMMTRTPAANTPAASGVQRLSGGSYTSGDGSFQSSWAQ